jgi:hypothetical protein
MAKRKEPKQPVGLRIYPELWSQVQHIAIDRKLKLWEVVDAALRMWLKSGKVGA